MAPEAAAEMVIDVMVKYSLTDVTLLALEPTRVSVTAIGPPEAVKVVPTIAKVTSDSSAAQVK